MICLICEKKKTSGLGEKHKTLLLNLIGLFLDYYYLF